ncbi:MAG: hypothetical protein ACI9Q9_001115, partial [Flavobacterium sp.]
FALFAAGFKFEFLVNWKRKHILTSYDVTVVPLMGSKFFPVSEFLTLY